MGSPCPILQRLYPALILVFSYSLDFRFCVVLCKAAPFADTPGDESCMRDAKSRVRDEKELVVYSGTRNQDQRIIDRRKVI